MKSFSSVNYLFYCCLLLLSGQAVFGQSPGGVSANLEFWVKGGVGAGTVGSNSSQWNDQSGNGFNATQTTAAARPVVSANQINFNTALLFNGSSDYMDVASPVAITGTNPYAIYYVLKQSGTATQVFFGPQLAVNAPPSLDMQLYNSPGTSALIQDCFALGTVMTGTTITPSGVPYIAGFERTGAGANGATLYYNGNLEQTATVSQSLGSHNKRIGASYIATGPAYFVSGDIAEVIIYKTALPSSTARLSVLSYLGLKYGLPPPTGSGFISSTGTSIWAYDATYANNVFGIGRDDGSGLTQSSSNSSFTGSGNGTGQSGKGNVVLSSPSVLNNLNFIVLGNNSGALTETTTNLPPGSATGVLRIGRQWKVNNNTGGATVNFAFNTAGLTLSGTTVTDFSMLIDKDGDGNFATGSITDIPASSYSGGIVSFNGITLPNNAVVTLVTKNAVLLPLDFTSFTARGVSPGQVYLQWDVSNEVNVRKFSVERSTDGNLFNEIGEEAFTTANQYSFTDDHAAPGNNFYRIKSIDLDGQFLYSTVAEVSSMPDAPLTVQLLNNGAGVDNPLLQLTAANPVVVTIRLLTSDGHLLSKLRVSLAAGTVRQELMTSHLAHGSYVVEIAGKGYDKSFLLIR